MPTPPEQITTGRMRRRWRGYDRAEVDALLTAVRTDYSGAVERVAALAEERDQYRASQERLQQRLAEIGDSARQAAEAARRNGESEADAIRDRAQRAASLMITQAEEAASALGRQAHALRAQAEQETNTARRHLAEADRRVQQLEEAARVRWDALRTETENRFDHLRLAERRFAQRILQVEEALAAVRTQMQPNLAHEQNHNPPPQ